MRAALVLFLLVAVRLHAETLAEKLEVFGGQWRLLQGGRLEIVPYSSVRLWIDGKRIDTQDSFVVRPGDYVDVWEPPICYRYRFDSITSTGVVITRRTFAAVEVEQDENHTALRSGRLLKVETIRAGVADFPMMIWEDIPSGVELGPSAVSRSKSGKN